MHRRLGFKLQTSPSLQTTTTRCETTMEVLPSQPSGPAPQRRRDRRQRRHGDYRQHGKPTMTRHLKENDLALRTLGEGPVPRSKEKNDEYIQTWLQQTQARHSRLPKTDHEKGRPQLSDQFRPRTVADRNRSRKRSRSLSEQPLPPPKAAEQVEYRFEKRARHRTRDDKYDYKARGGTKPKRVSDQEFPEYGAHDNAERVQGARHRHSVGKQSPGLSTPKQC